MATGGLYGQAPSVNTAVTSNAESTGLYGTTTTGSLIAQPGAESSGLYGNGTSFGGTYFEWFIFQEGSTQPATPTGGSWDFLTNTGTVPAGWSLQPPAAPANQVWVSIAFINSKSPSTVTWSEPGLMGTVPQITLAPTVTGAAGSNAIVVNLGDAINPEFQFTIPRGDTGVGVQSIVQTNIGDYAYLTITYTDSSSEQLGPIGVSDDILITVSDNIVSITAVGDNIAAVNAVYVNLTAIQNCDTNMAAIIAAPSAASAAAASAAAALTSETAAASSASAASTSATNAASSASAASTSATNAASSATDAASSASFAASSATAASSSATAAAASESAAAGSATSAASSATAAASSASNAATSATAAASSATNAANSASNAAISEANASASELAAATSATNALNSETAAAASETNAASSASAALASQTAAAASQVAAAASEAAAASSASAASASASAAATSETNAATSAAAALVSETNTAALYDNFDDRYLGPKSADPTTDNDGNPLLTGALYWNDVVNVMKAYNGSAWEAAYAPVSGYMQKSVTATDNALVRFDGTAGDTVQNSVIIVDDNGAVSGVDSIQFDLSPTVVPTTPGSLYWDAADGNQTLSLVMADGTATQQIGEEQYFRIKASSAITNGQVVMFTGTVGASGGLTGAPATGLTASTASYVMGIATQDIAHNGWGYVTSFGLVRNLNTAAFTAGQILYLDPTVAGGLTATEPVAPNPKVIVCACVYSSASVGSLFVRPAFGGKLGQFEGDVEINSATANDSLFYNGVHWENYAPSAARTALGLGTSAVLNAASANGVATLDAGGTIPLSQIPASLQGGVSYQGTWNASTNTPTLTSSVGSKGYYYVVSVAGSTNLNGITDWVVGDWAIFNGTAWEKVDNTESVTSVNGYTGAVVLTNTDVGAPTTTGTGASGTWGISITGSAPTLTTGRTIAMTGDVSYTSGSFNGSANVTGTATLANSGVTAGTYGSSTQIPVVTVDAKGRVTSASTSSITVGDGTLTVSGGTGLSGSGTFTANQGTNTTITLTNADPGSSQAIFKNVAVTGQTTIVADTNNDTLTVAAGTGVSLTTDAATDTLTITNSAPDQTVALSSGTGISVSGAYPNFTITNTSPSSGGTVTSVATSGAITGGTITTTGTISHSTADGYLHVPATSTTNNGKVLTAGATAGSLSWQTPATGTVTSVSGTGSYGGLTLSGTVTSSGNLTLGGTPTGTWPISVSGNAATATTANSSPLLSGLGMYVWSESTLPASYNNGIQASFVSGYQGFQNYGSVMTMNTYSGGGGALQLYVPYSPTYGGTGMQVRFGNYDVSSGNSWTSWKTLLASDNYNSYSPTLTGGGASGTWNISISGNAATATSADQIDGWGFRNTGSNSGVNADTIDSNGITYYTSGVPNFTGNATDGALYSQAYSSSWQHQIAADYRSGQIALRGKNSGTWQAWRTVLDSSNYNSYAPTLTGGGASGTWGISISGNAATASNGGVTSVNGMTGAVTVGGGIPSGTLMLFVQTSAPTGWTKSTTHNDKALRVVSGTVTTGGSAGFTTAFGTPSVSGSLSGTVGATTLTTDQIPSHVHSITSVRQIAGSRWPGGVEGATSTFNSAATGGGLSHTHSFSGSLSSATAAINVAYVDVIIASKD